jgi:hypothetical protein
MSGMMLAPGGGGGGALLPHGMRAPMAARVHECRFRTRKTTQRRGQSQRIEALRWHDDRHSVTRQRNRETLRNSDRHGPFSGL